MTTKRLIFSLLPFFWSSSWYIRSLVILSGIFTILSIALIVYLPLVLRKVVNYLSGHYHQTFYLTLIILTGYGICWTLSQILPHLRSMLLYRVMERGTRLICNKIFIHLINLSQDFHAERKTGSIISALDRAQDAFPRLINALLWQIFPLVSEIVIALIIVIKLYNYIYALILFFTISLYLTSTLVTVKQSNISQNNRIKQHQNISSHFLDTILNLENIKYFVNEDYEIQKWDDVLIKKENITTAANIRMELIVLSQMIIVGLGLTTMTLYAGYQILRHQLTIGDFVLLNGYLLQFSLPLSYFGFVAIGIRQAIADMNSIMQLLNQQPGITDSPIAKPIKMTKEEIEFKDVTFSYDHERRALNQVSFNIPAGKTIAIVGETGAGKSTITKLLLRFYDPTSGSVLVSGQNIKNVTINSLRAQFGVVPQDINLFNRSIYENIAYGNLHATYADIEEAVKRAHLDRLIKSLPDGYNTVVGERGIKLSGGERQRIAIARILVKKPSFYIFDEATSSLDAKTEQLILENIKEISTNLTTLIISHRLSSVMCADQILVLEQGNIIEVGSHHELMTRQKKYAALWKKQMQEMSEYHQ